MIDSIFTAKSDVSNQTIKKLKKKFVDFQSKYQLNFTSNVGNGVVKSENEIKLFLTLDEDFLDTLTNRLKKKMETDRKVKVKKKK